MAKKFKRKNPVYIPDSRGMKGYMWNNEEIKQRKLADEIQKKLKNGGI